MSSARPHLFFATIAAGGGHVASARAMAQAIAALEPERFDLSVSDYMSDLGASAPEVARFDKQHKDGWRWALRYPLSARLGQRLIDSVPALTMRVQRSLLDPFARAAAADLARRSPQLVVSNHGLLTTGLALARRRYGLKTPVLTFATEPHNISAYWADPWAEHILVPNEETRRRLKRMGVPAAKLEVVGYPVQQAFLQAPDKAAARAQLGLEERFTVLLSLGGEGFGGDAARLVLELAVSNPHWLVLAMCGRNAGLKREIDTLCLRNVRSEDFSERMAVYLAASDVVVGKAGPASVYEALAVGRPVLATSYAGLNERGVLRFLASERLGEFLPASSDLITHLRAYQAEPEKLAEVGQRCRALDLAGQTERVARRVVSYCETTP